MNVRIQQSFSFLAGVFDSTEGLLMNEYSLTLDFITNTVNSVEQNIAFDRVNYFIDNIVSNAVFVCDTDSDTGKHLHSAGIRVITLPEEPYDQIVGLALYAKLNAIMEQRMFITDCEISSRNGRHVSYMHAAEESIGPFELPGWWNDSGLTFCNKKLLARDKKVVKLVKSEDSWRNFNLDWEAGAEEPGESNVVVVKFDHEKE